MVQTTTNQKEQGVDCTRDEVKPSNTIIEAYHGSGRLYEGGRYSVTVYKNPRRLLFISGLTF